MFDFALFRHRNFLAANLSQVLAGAVELGLGFLLPFYLLLGVGVSPQAAGIALIPSTIPIILAGPLAGRAYDRVGSRVPLVVGFLVLAASGVALSVAADDLTVTALIPGLVLQGIGLGVVLTVNDPTGLNAVPEESRGAAAGMLNTAEQLGGAIGIAALTAVTLHIYYDRLFERLARHGIHPTVAQIDTFREFVVQAEQRGLHGVPTHSRVVTRAIGDSLAARVHAYGITFLIVAGLAVAGALICFSLTRPARAAPRMRILGRRSRWALAAAGDRPATRPGVSRA
jgi:MFS family permease